MYVGSSLDNIRYTGLNFSLLAREYDDAGIIILFETFDFADVAEILCSCFGIQTERQTECIPSFVLECPVECDIHRHILGDDRLCFVFFVQSKVRSPVGELEIIGLEPSF